jgi:ankyrin repeat protein
VCKGPGPLNLLISLDASIFVKDKNEFTPIMLAAKYGRIKNLEAILEKDSAICPKFKTKSGISAIHLAAESGHTECV